jgi:hypothetical protein
MKLAILAFCLSLATNVFSQLNIPNGGFETWGYYNTWSLDPESWQCGNNQLASNVFPDSSAYDGDLAMQVFPNSFFEALPGYASIEIPTSAIPASFDFAVKAYIEGLDSVRVRVSFINTNGGGDWVIQEEKEWNTDASIPNWQVVSIPLDQIEPVIDLCVINVIAGYGQPFLEGSLNTWISVDAMGFDGLSNSVSVISNPEEVRLFYSRALSQLVPVGLDNPRKVKRVRIFSSHGTLVCTTSDYTLPRRLASGIYTYQFIHEGVQYTGKFGVP